MAKRYIDKSIEEQQAERADAFSKRMQNLKSGSMETFDNLSRMATGLVKEEIFGIPGLLGDLAEPAAAIMNPVLYGSSPEIRENLSEFQKDFGAVGLAKAAGVELSDDFLDDEGELRPEMVGRMLAPGALYAKGAALLPELSSGVQALVRGLKDDGFFPAGGPQPATVSGPSLMTQGPTDAGPRSNVFKSEAQGTPTGGEKPLVQAEKEDRFVSPENPAVIEQGPPETTTGASISGVSETGVYMPVKAALENIDIPAGGIAANKLLEKLRGQPRAGSELKATGFADFLKMRGNAKITKDEIDLVYDGMSPAPVVRTVMHAPYRYDGKTIVGTDFGYDMQRQIGARDTQYNYGVILFGDEKNKVGGKPTQTVSTHRYFGEGTTGKNLLPTTYGHVRFSTQDMLDPVTNKPMRVLLVEEIQSDLVRAFAGADRARKSVKSVDKIKKDLVEQNPNAALYQRAGDDAALTLMAENLHEQQLASAETAAKGLLDGKAVYGPGEKLADATLDIHPDVVKYKSMQEKIDLSEGKTDLFDSPQMRAVEQRLDDGIEETILDHSKAVDQFKFIIQHDLDKAKTEAEAIDTMKRLYANGVELPQSKFRNQRQEEVNLTSIEIAGERMKALAREITSQRAGAERRLAARKKDTSGIMSKITSKFTGKSVEKDLNDMTREGLLSDIPFQVKESLINKYTYDVYKRQRDNLFKARQKNLEANETVDFFEEPDFKVPLLAGSERMNRVTGKGEPIAFRKGLSNDEVLEAIDAEELESFVDDAARLLATDMQILSDADPMFRGVSKRYAPDGTPQDFRFLKYDIKTNILNRLGSEDAVELAQADHYKENLLNKIAEAKDSAPTPKEMVTQIDKILSDEQGVGDLFRRRYNLDNDADAIRIAANPQMLSEQMLSASDYISRPPFETQNDFIQYAMRTIASEAKKLEVDAVIVPSVEEMVMARAEHRTVAEGPAGIKQIEDFKAGLAKEKEIRGAVQKLKSRGQKWKKHVLTEDEIKELQELGTTAFEDLGYGVPKTAGEAVDALNSLTIDMGGGDVRMLRGHFQNYGDSLDASLSNLRKDGFDVSELDAFNVRQAVYSDRFTPLGEYAKRKKSKLAKYRMIDLREGKEGADVAKKVPSLYNKGGHVDVRGGIGAMARSVM